MRDNIRFVLISLIVWVGFDNVDGTCTFPTTWDSTWYDSSMTTSNVVFDRANLQVTSGWTVTAYASTVTSWTCVNHDTTNNLILFKGDQYINLFSSLQNAFRCLKYTKITDYSYMYYIYADIQVNANNARVYIESNDPSVTSWPTSSTYCNPSDLGTEEYAVLVKAGHLSDIKQYFPTPFLATSAYTHNDGSTTTCGTGSVWDVCTDRKIATVNYTQCATKQFYSTGGEGYCVYYTSSGSTYYTTIVNTDTTVDFSTTFRFTCYAVMSSGSTIYASDSKGQCERSQSPTVKQSDGTGTLVFTPYITCPFTDDNDTAGSSLGIIIGIVVAILLLLIALIVGIILYKKNKGKQKTMHQTLRENQVFPLTDMDLETYRDALSIGPTDEGRLPPITHRSNLPQNEAAEATTLPSSLPPIKKISIEELNPHDATAIDIPEKKQLDPIGEYIPNGVQTRPSGAAPLPPIIQTMN
ncbi:uncharacterized protein LOC133173382 [Saccostrea echinata]|uniref:uncharacterized protein LOC133173382 n=1 Tax=Saccostrea echinata TaxID=191078 RepID=UPI002A7F8AE7|nr:uncharacterized protein LOC133173382 [Saccostrea echinata]